MSGWGGAWPLSGWQRESQFFSSWRPATLWPTGAGEPWSRKWRSKVPPPDKLFFFIRIFLPFLSPSPDFCPALRLHFPNLLDVSIWMSCCHLKLDLTKSHLFSSTSVIIVTPVTQAGNPTASVNVFFSLAAINGSPNPVAWNLLRLSRPRGFLFPLVLPFLAQILLLSCLDCCPGWLCLQT